MKRLMQFFVLVALAGSVGAGPFVVSPLLRAKISRISAPILGWTDDARQADPEGFAEYVERRLSADLSELKTTRHDLAMEVGTLAKAEKEQRELLVHAEEFAAEYRTAYQAGSFPVSIRNAEYSADEVLSQTSLLLAEAEGYRQSLHKLSNTRQQAEQRLEQLAVRINSTEIQLATTATQQSLLRARVLSNEGEELVAQVDALLNTNSVVMHSNPVRSVRELLASSSNSDLNRPSLEVARQFLARKQKVDMATGKIQKPAAPLINSPVSNESTFVAIKPNDDSEPIFQQK